MAFIPEKFQRVLRMSVASKAKKVKQKGGLQELKIVHSVSRRGADVVTAEEVKTPRTVAGQKVSLSSQPNGSPSPTKRRKVDSQDNEPIPCHLKGPNDNRERQTLVFLLL
jgi:hypothetical protein